MLGSCFLSHLSGSEDFEMFAYDKEKIDITDSAALNDLFKRVSPDFVINCAAYTAVDDAESNRELAFAINGEACGTIAELCKREKAILIHFSTDYVFDGENEHGYSENDEPSAINVYGESKLLGEELIKKNIDQYYLVRTSWLFGPNGKNFVDTMIKLGRERDEVSVVKDQIGSPTYSHDICMAVIKNFLNPYLSNLPKHHEHALKESSEFGEKLEFGIYHLTNAGFVSWYEFAQKIFELMGMDVKVKPVTSDEFVRAAKRPHYSVLQNTKLASLRPWQEALKAYLELNY